MAGIYLHIPFCKQACHYCDFHFSTQVKSMPDLLQAMHRELQSRRNYLEGETVETIYFGGGTPSLLATDDLKRLIDAIHGYFPVASNAEITLEANPDDLSYHKIIELARTPVNRLSIGIQSFRDQDLQWMNRAHSSSQADFSVKCAQDRGFENITIDLIYSIPGLSDRDWMENIRKAVDLQIQHISAYSLTIEPQTAFGRQLAKQELQPVDDETGSKEFITLVQELARSGFQQYEVSNFCKPGMESKHNSAYWLGKKYLGIGPSAHSFNGTSRQWNVSNNPRYAKGWMTGVPELETEMLDDRTRINEYLMTRLRTTWGVDLEFLQNTYGIDLWQLEKSRFEELIGDGLMHKDNHIITLTTHGLLRADRIASELFILES
jgi:oxygen-independent coproporphyrinogen III oxidase